MILASRSYVEKARAMGTSGLVVIDNFKSEITKNVQSEELLSKTSVRKKKAD